MVLVEKALIQLLQMVVLLLLLQAVVTEHPVVLEVQDRAEVLIMALQEVLVMQEVILPQKETMAELLQVMHLEVPAELVAAVAQAQLEETQWLVAQEQHLQLTQLKELVAAAEHKLLVAVDLVELVAAETEVLEMLMVVRLKQITAAVAADLVHLFQCKELVEMVVLE